MKFKQFDIWLADLNPRFGTEEGKTRPVIIVQTDLLNQVHLSTIICPLTTNIKQDTELLRVNLPASQFGLKEESAIMIDQIRAIDIKRLIKKIGSVSNNYRTHIKENIKNILDIDV